MQISGFSTYLRAEWKRRKREFKINYRRRFGHYIKSREYRLRFKINTKSDQYVFREIYGKQDAYRRHELIPRLAGGTIVDIGAHKGFFAILAATTAKRVVAFEPSPLNYAYLLSNIRENRAANVQAVQKAVSGDSEKRILTLSTRTAARNSFYQSTFTGAGKPIEVECTTLADLIDEHGLDRVDLLKLDCEGGEYDILMNAGTDVFSRISAIALEIHEFASLPGTKAEMVRFLEHHGFQGKVYDERVMDKMRLTMAVFTKPNAFSLQPATT